MVLAPTVGVKPRRLAVRAPGANHAPMHETTGTTAGNPSLRWWSAGQRGPRVLLIMGFGMRGDIWRPQIEDLRGDHRVAWFDNRGIGESERGPKRLWTMKDMARDTLRVMDALGWEDAHLVGVSMGGMIAQETALMAESRLRSLSLIVTHEGGRLGWLPTAEGLRRFLEVHFRREDERFEALQRLLYPPEFLATCDPDELRARMEAQVGRRVSKDTFLGQLHAVLRHDTGSRLGQLRLPTLVIKAGRDVLVPPARSDRLRRRIAHARLVEFPEAGHGVTFQCKHELSAALRRHFAQAELEAMAARQPTVHA